MIPIVPEKRRDGRSSFIQLVSYLTLRDEDKPDLPISPENPYVRPSRSKAAIFDRLVGYLDRNAGGGAADPFGYVCRRYAAG